MIKVIKEIFKNKIIRYIFFGGLATVVNMGSFFLLRYLAKLDINIANCISIAMAILFAYFTNSNFVFDSEVNGFRERIAEFLRFVSARITTMVIEIGGVWLLVEKLYLNDMISKLVIQFVVLVLNYVFSKFLIFKNKG